jgi:hypothetical protein
MLRHGSEEYGSLAMLPKLRSLSAFPGICDPAAVLHCWLELLCRMDRSVRKIVIEGADLMFE